MHRDDFPEFQRDGKPQPGDFRTSTTGRTGLAKPPAQPKPSAVREAPPATFTEAGGVLIQTRTFDGDGAARWRVRVEFDGEVAGQQVVKGDELVIGSALFRSILHLPYRLISSEA